MGGRIERGGGGGGIKRKINLIALLEGIIDSIPMRTRYTVLVKTITVPHF